MQGEKEGGREGGGGGVSYYNIISKQLAGDLFLVANKGAWEFKGSNRLPSILVVTVAEAGILSAAVTAVTTYVRSNMKEGTFEICFSFSHGNLTLFHKKGDTFQCTLVIHSRSLVLKCQCHTLFMASIIILHSVKYSHFIENGWGMRPPRVIALGYCIPPGNIQANRLVIFSSIQ